MRSRMRAALVNAFDKPPSFGSFAPPPAPSPSDVLIKVSAVAIAPAVRMSAAGLLYTPGVKFPFVPGLDGVGHLVEKPSSRVYFAFPAGQGTLSETVVMPRSNVIPVPDGLSDAEAAAIVNPAASSWTALTRRTKLRRGETVLVNGATGAAGRLAVQVAKHLGAGRIIATGRNVQRLEEARALGADELIVLDGSKEEMVARFKAVVLSGVDVVLDYLWGASAEQILTACLGTGSRKEVSRRIRFINIGVSSGLNITMPATPLRTSNLEILGSGLGSEPDSEVLASMGETLQAVAEGGFKVDVQTAPLEDVETAWTKSDKDKRLVITF